MTPRAILPNLLPAILTLYCSIQTPLSRYGWVWALYTAPSSSMLRLEKDACPMVKNESRQQMSTLPPTPIFQSSWSYRRSLWLKRGAICEKATRLFIEAIVKSWQALLLYFCPRFGSTILSLHEHVSSL